MFILCAKLGILTIKIRLPYRQSSFQTKESKGEKRKYGVIKIKMPYFCQVQAGLSLFGSDLVWMEKRKVRAT